MDVQQSPPAPQAISQQVPQASSTPVVQPSPSSVPTTLPPVPTVPPKNMSTIVWWIVGAVVSLLLLASGAYFFLPKNELIIADQPLGPSIYVNRLSLTRPASLIISRVSVVDGINTVAHTSLLEPEEYRDFQVHIEQDLIATPIVPGDLLYGTLYEDTDEDKALDENKDKPLRDIFGRQTKIYFKIL